MGKISIIFNENLKNLIPPWDFHKENINNIIEQFSEFILKAADLSIPKSTLNLQKKSVPWWNEECKTAIKNKNVAFNHYKRHPTLTNKIEFLKLRATARRQIKQSKHISWINFVSTLNNQTASHIVWDRIRRVRGINNTMQIKCLNNSQDTTILTSPKDIANLL